MEGPHQLKTQRETRACTSARAELLAEGASFAGSKCGSSNLVSRGKPPAPAESPSRCRGFHPLFRVPETKFFRNKHLNYFGCLCNSGYARVAITRFNYGGAILTDCAVRLRKERMSSTFPQEH